MMIHVDRYLSTNEATLSTLSVDGAFFCYGIEDEFRAVKIPGETRIPAGVYRIKLKDFGRWHEKLKADRRFRDIHMGALWVKDVPNFEGILIHPGNAESETEGCLLVGMARDETRMTVERSGEGYRALYLKVRLAAERGRLQIEYQDNDR